MTQKSKAALQSASPYNAAITREQYLFYEVRTTAKLLTEGLSADEVAERIVSENLFQYPTEKSVRKMALACLRRLDALQDETLVQAIATQSSDVAKQICLYAMMKQYRLVWDFMVTVIGEKYRLKDTKLKQVLQKTLVDNEYIDSTKAEHLNPVLISPVLENAIRSNNDDAALVAFNCFM